MNLIDDQCVNECFVTPQMFGAKADGSTDDASAIQKAFNASQHVFFPKGVYIVKSTITIKRNTHAWGIPAASKIRAHSTFSGDYIFQIIDNPSSFLLENLELDCNDVKGLGGLFLLRPYNRCVVRDFTVTKCGGYAIFVGDTTAGKSTRDTRSQTLLIDNCLFMGSSKTVPTAPLGFFYNSFELNLSNTKFLFSGSNVYTKSCLVLDKCNDAYVRGCSFAHTAGPAVEITGGTRYFRFVGNTYENIGTSTPVLGAPSGYSIYCHGKPGSLIANGYFLERIYYNVAPKIKLEYTVKTMFAGDFVLDDDAENSYGNVVVSLNEASNTSENAFIGLNNASLVNGKEFSLKAGGSCTIKHTNSILVFTDRGGLWSEGINGRSLSAISTTSTISVKRTDNKTLTVINNGSYSTRICAFGLGKITIT